MAGATVALAVLLVSCSGDTERGGGVGDPFVEHLEQAADIAADEWNAPWILDLASARYRSDGDDLVLEDRAYVFVSDDGAASYYLVRLHADGTVSSGGVAGIARTRPEAFDFAHNEVTSDDALDVAWSSFGEALVERCGPLRWLDVTGTRDSEGRQSWSVEYRIGGQTHTVWLNAVTGSVIDIDEEPC